MKAMTVMTLAFLLAAFPAVAQVPDDKLVVPGQRIGKWTLEMTIDGLLRMNGPLRAIGGGATVRRLPEPRSQADAWVHRWDHLGLRVWTIGRESQKIILMAATTDEFKTAEGISPGVTRETVEAAYGRPTTVIEEQSWVGVYDEIGLSVAVAFSVRVFRPGTAKQIWRF